MTDKTKKGGKKGRKIGRAAKHPCHVAYTVGNHRFRNKLKRMRRSSGEKAALEYTQLYKVGKHA